MDVDDTLVLILERIDSPVSLIRAASTCRRWRRVIADAGFLRRFRSLHGPLVAGDYCNGYYPSRAVWYVPSSSIDDVRQFSLDFVVDMNIIPPQEFDDTPSWEVLDSRGSLLLMKCIHETHIPNVFPDIVVCEPLTQRFKAIPQPPDFDGVNHYIFHGPYLVDGNEDAAGGCIGMSNFRVLCVLFSSGDKVSHTIVFTARDMDSTWSEKATDHIVSRLHPRDTSPCLGQVLGLRYYHVLFGGVLITCNSSTGKFSLLELSHAIKTRWGFHIWRESYFSVVDGGDGEPRIIAMMDHTMEVFRRVDGEWTLDNKILLSNVTCDLPGYPLSFDGSPKIIKRGVGFVVISWWALEQYWQFSIDLKTMEVAPVTDGSKEKIVYRCEFPWPPLLNACLDRCRRY